MKFSDIEVGKTYTTKWGQQFRCTDKKPRHPAAVGGEWVLNGARCFVATRNVLGEVEAAAPAKPDTRTADALEWASKAFAPKPAAPDEPTLALTKSECDLAARGLAQLVGSAPVALCAKAEALIAKLDEFVSRLDVGGRQ